VEEFGSPNSLTRISACPVACIIMSSYRYLLHLALALDQSRL